MIQLQNDYVEKISNNSNKYKLIYINKNINNSFNQ